MTVEQLPGVEAQSPAAVTAIGYTALTERREQYEFGGLSFSPNPAYEKYLLMHKVIVGKRGAEQLKGIHAELKDEVLPRYVSAAGWAAVEASLILDDIPAPDRIDLIEEGVDCWRRSLQMQRDLNSDAPDCLIDNTGPYRAALDMAISPLLKGMVLGYVSRKACREVFEDCLTIAQANAVRINIMARQRDFAGLGDHLGFGFECNALLAFNRRFAGTRFAIPSLLRSDSGHHYGEQTHDLSIIEQQRGELVRLTPVEIKASTKKSDRMRYKALLVRGRGHLAPAGEMGPIETLDAITACYEGTATVQDKRLVESITTLVMGMYKDYCAGDSLVDFTTKRSVTGFHDNARVIANHSSYLPRAV